MKKITGIVMIFLVGLVSVIAVSGDTFNNPDSASFSNINSRQYYQPSFNDYYSSQTRSSYWPILNDIRNDRCEEAQDFLVMIPPLGCQPAVVRSDLLADQNVPVFCQLEAFKVNPLVDASAIDSISFKGDVPEGVAGISYHPARAAIRTHDTLLGDPLMNNIGYVVIVLEKNSNENEQPKTISGNLTAIMRYDAEEAFGVGKGEYYLPVLNDSAWQTDYPAYSFWNGKGYLRVLGMEGNNVRVGIYTDKDHLFKTVTLKEGEQSNEIFFPGFYCRAKLRVKVNKIDSADDKVKIYVDGNPFWLKKGQRFLDGSCSVRDIQPTGAGTGVASLNCRDNGDFDLGLLVKGAVIDGQTIQIGKEVSGSAEKGFKYLAYAGEVPDYVAQNAGKEFIVTINKSEERDLTNNEIADYLKEVSRINLQNREINYSTMGSGQSFVSELKKIFGDNMIISLAGKNGFSELGGGGENENADANQLSNFSAAKKAWENMVYEGLEFERMESGSTYGEQSLWDLIKTARELREFEDERELLEQFVEKYPSSSLHDRAASDLRKISMYDTSRASTVVFVKGKSYSLIADDFVSVGKDKKSVTMGVGSKSGKYAENEKVSLDGEICGFVSTTTGSSNTKDGCSEKSYFVVSDIEHDRVKLDLYEYDSERKIHSRKFVVLYEDSLQGENNLEFDGRTLYLRAIDLVEEVYVSLNPVVNNQRSEAEFGFSIGVEQRAIKLSPETAKEKIVNINASIEKWQERQEKLASLVKVMKGGCLTASAYVTINSLFAGVGGTAAARRTVMAKYREECDILVARGDYKSRSECYNSEYGEGIEDDVEAEAGWREEWNNDYSSLDNDGDITGVRNKLAGDLGCSSNKDACVFEGQTFDLTKMSINELRDLYELNKRKGYYSGKTGAYEQFDSSLDSEIKLFGDSHKNLHSDVDVNFESLDDLKREQAPIGNTDSDGNEIDWGNQEAATIRREINGVKYLIELEKPNNLGKSTIISVKKVDGKDDLLGSSLGKSEESLSIDEKNALKILKDYKFVKSSCSRGYSDSGAKTAMVKYFEYGSDKGMPAEVPFDKDGGWYVKVLEGGYTDAGVLRDYQICNVGPDGRQGTSDDNRYCQSVSPNSNVDTFLACSEITSSEFKRIKDKAYRAVQNVQQQYGKTQIQVRGSGFSELGNDLINAGIQTLGDSDLDCEELMPKEQCSLLFNMCDPVVCPTSRCDLGGKYPVSNVIQTGIVGGVSLCLPNFGNPSNGGVAIPFCLSGINAGLEMYISILESEQKCLQENIDSGKYVGICDEITAVYTCDFWWKQISPFTDVILEKGVDFLTGGGLSRTRGGGEYLNTRATVENFQNSIDYWKNTYAQNVYQVFKFRNVQEIGSEICKANIGTTIPNSADLVDQLLEPESPPQFYARFDEMVYTEATVPSTSQYKVYYHIFAGNNRGVSYSIFLKDPPEQGYYRQNPYVSLYSGYLSAGDTLDETVDFTAPSGYKQLCVRIDAQEECGFGQVTTDFGLDYLQDKYVESQAKQDEIKTAKECIQGSSSLLGLVNPNIQEGLDNVLNPDLTKSGVVRVCSGASPGSGVDPDRWKAVGYCDDRDVICWLDKDSVRDEISKISAIEGTLAGSSDALDVLFTEEQKATYEAVASEIENIDDGIRGMTNTGDINAISEKIFDALEMGGSNVQKAELYSLEISLYLKAVNILRDGDGQVVAQETAALQPADADGGDEPPEKDYKITSVSVTEPIEQETKLQYTVVGGEDCVKKEERLMKERRLVSTWGWTDFLKKDKEITNKYEDFDDTTPENKILKAAPGKNYYLVVRCLDKDGNKLSEAKSEKFEILRGDGETVVEEEVSQQLSVRVDKTFSEMEALLSNGNFEEEGVIAFKTDGVVFTSTDLSFMNEYDLKAVGVLDEHIKGLSGKNKKEIESYLTDLKVSKNSFCARTNSPTKDLDCGPSTLYSAITYLNGGAINGETLDKKRRGGLARGFLSIFSEEARSITWPSEMRRIPKDYGLEVKVFDGNKATIENILSESQKGNAVIVHLKYSFFDQHYAFFDVEEIGGLVKVDGSCVSQGCISKMEELYPPKNIKALYVLSKSS